LPVAARRCAHRLFGHSGPLLWRASILLLICMHRGGVRLCLLNNPFGDQDAGSHTSFLRAPAPPPSQFIAVEHIHRSSSRFAAFSTTASSHSALSAGSLNTFACIPSHRCRASRATGWNRRRRGGIRTSVPAGPPARDRVSHRRACRLPTLIRPSVCRRETRAHHHLRDASHAYYRASAATDATL